YCRGVPQPEVGMRQCGDHPSPPPSPVRRAARLVSGGLRVGPFGQPLDLLVLRDDAAADVLNRIWPSSRRQEFLCNEQVAPLLPEFRHASARRGQVGLLPGAVMLAPEDEQIVTLLAG